MEYMYKFKCDYWYTIYTINSDGKALAVFFYTFCMDQMNEIQLVNVGAFEARRQNLWSSLFLVWANIN